MEIPIVVSDEIASPSDVPRSGDRRLVKLLPTPFGSRPAIWTSPYTLPIVMKEGEPPETCRVCVMLISKGSPSEKAEILPIYIPAAAIQLFPDVPVEW